MLDMKFKTTLSESHEYKVDGVAKPGFTHIAKSMGVIKENPFYTEEGREQGIALSKWSLFLAKKQEPESEPDLRIAGRVAGFRKFMAESNFEFVGGEQPLYHPQLNFCGMPDLYGNLRGFSSVIDVKRGAKLKWHRLQLACYKMLLEENGFWPTKRYGLYLRDEGYSLVEYSDEEDEELWLAIVAGYYAVEAYK